VSDGAKMYAEK